MRDAINNNPKVQIAVIGVLIVVAGLFFMTTMKGGSSSSSSSSSSTTPAASSPVVGATTAPVAVPSAGATASPSGSTEAVPSISATSDTVTPQALIPGPGLPRDVVKAWKGGATIALLIVRPKGIDDRLVRTSVEALSSEPRVAVFIGRVANIARYSRITQGVGVDRAPALVVVRPRGVSGSVPEAQVSYGFRDPQSVVQAVHDAVYSGRDDLPYSPR
jgi:hypothetical protein